MENEGKKFKWIEGTNPYQQIEDIRTHLHKALKEKLLSFTTSCARAYPYLFPHSHEIDIYAI
jgi:hypothetical protein